MSDEEDGSDEEESDGDESSDNEDGSPDDYFVDENRIDRALSQTLLLVDRSDDEFSVLGATRKVYTVTLSLTPSCNCPDMTSPCKHMYFVFLRVLSVSLDDACLRKKNLHPSHLRRLLRTETSPESLADDEIIEIYHREAAKSKKNSSVGATDERKCPVCLDEMGQAQKVVACVTCWDAIHEECLLEWKNCSQRKSWTCVICKSRWRNQADDKYLDLSAYISEDENYLEEQRSYKRSHRKRYRRGWYDD